MELRSLYFAILLSLVCGVCGIQIAQAEQVIKWDDNPNILHITQGQHTFTCSATTDETVLHNAIWGTDIYTSDSSICTAAVHAGFIADYKQGGTVTIEMRPGQSSYQGSSRDGVTSSNYGQWAGSYVFVTPSTPTSTFYSQPNYPSDLHPNAYNSNWTPTVKGPKVTLDWWVTGTANNLYPVDHWLEIYYLDSSTQSWKPAWSGYVGTPTYMGSRMSIEFTFTPNNYYIWRVYSVDPAKHTSVWYAPSNWSGFYVSS